VPKKAQPKWGWPFKSPEKAAAPARCLEGVTSQTDIVADILLRETECVEVSCLRGDDVWEAGQPALQPAYPEGAKSTISVVDQETS